MASFRNSRQATCYASDVSHEKPYDGRSRDSSISQNSETFYLSSSENVSDSSTEMLESSINSDLSFPKIARFIYRCVNCEYFSFSEEKMNRHIALMHTVSMDGSTNLMLSSGTSVTIRIRSNDELNPEKYKLGSRYICNECPYVTHEDKEFFPHINIHSWLKDVRINALTPDEAWQPIDRKIHT